MTRARDVTRAEALDVVSRVPAPARAVSAYARDETATRIGIQRLELYSEPRTRRTRAQPSCRFVGYHEQYGRPTLIVESTLIGRATEPKLSPEKAAQRRPERNG